MKNYNLKSKIIFGFFAAIFIFAFIFLISGRFGEKKTAGALDEFAKCLASKNITMYGAVWCSHCQNQKKLFGDSFKYVPYVECPDNPSVCISKGIEGYPTWIFPDGRKLIGEQSLEKLSQESACVLPVK